LASRTERFDVRVIAGHARGKTLKSPTSDRIRPTGDKVKGAIFSLLEAQAYKLGFGVASADDDDRFAAARAWPRVLDLYAGSGALGIEALSRGAEQADFVDADPAARKLIAENLRLTGLAEHGRIHGLRAEQVPSALAGDYDVLLADPPYGVEAAPILAEIADSPRLTDRGVLVWEHHRDMQPPERLGRLRLLRSRRHGLTSISLYAGSAVDDQPPEGADPEQTDT
jgi:16S rRNA (guanine(966)-N(2))-methyltransferase RsmD